MSSDPIDAKAIFLEALQLSTPSDQSEFLDRACGENLALRTRIENLLKVAAEPDSLFDRPLTEFQHSPAAVPSSDRLDFLEAHGHSRAYWPAWGVSNCRSDWSRRHGNRL